MRRIGLILSVASVFVAGCASTHGARPDPRDPLERMNRATFAFNDALDRAVLKPVAKGYKKVTPHFMQVGVSNFMDNLGYPVTLVNDLLQGKFKATLNDTGRLLLNTTVGLGGILDPATDAGLDRNDEDFGQTLGRWHVRPGAYLVLPFLGPSDLRDGAGRLADHFTSGHYYLTRGHGTLGQSWVNYGLYVVDVIDTRARYLSLEPTLEQAFDKYAFMRNAYLQRRQYLVTDGAVEDESLEEPDAADQSPGK